MRTAWILVVLGGLWAGCGGASGAAAPSSTSGSTASGATASSASAASSTEARPMTPSRVDVMNGMSAITPDVHACLGAYRGRSVVVGFTLSSDGTVTEASVIPPDSPRAADGLPVSEVALDPSTLACVEAAARAFRVAPFERQTFFVNFPFRLR